MHAPTPVLLGYADRFSVAPGESIRFMVSCEAPTSMYTATWDNRRNCPTA